MSAVAAPAPSVDERVILRQLTAIQARRYVTHPLYVVGVALLVLTAFPSAHSAGRDPSTFAATGWMAAFFLGVLGLVVAYRLTRTEDQALALLPSAPIQGSTRTLALLGACLVPAGTAAVYLVTRLVAYSLTDPYAPFPSLVEAMGGWGVVVASLLDTVVVASFGGPAIGVAVGRWLRFPGAGVLVAIGLVLVVAFTSGNANQNNTILEHKQDDVVLQSSATVMPWTAYETSGCAGGIGQSCTWTLDGVRDGSPVGHLLYSLFLSVLACWAAVMRDAVGAVRRRWVRIGWAAAVGALLSLAWALLG